MRSSSRSKSSRLRWLAAGVVLSLLLAGPARGADREFVGVLALASDDAVAKQLGLSDSVRKQLQDLIDKRIDEVTDLVLEIKDLSAAERTAKLAPFVQKSEELGLALLSEPQRQLLERIRLGQAGMASLGEPAVMQRLGLSDQQQADIQRLLQERSAASQNGDGQARQAAVADCDKRLWAALSPQQRGDWEKLSSTSPGGNGARRVGGRVAQARGPGRAAVRSRRRAPPGNAGSARDVAGPARPDRAS